MKLFPVMENPGNVLMQIKIEMVNTDCLSNILSAGVFVNRILCFIYLFIFGNFRLRIV